MGSKKRLANVHRIRRNSTYSMQEISELLHVHVNSARQWVKNGLPMIDKQKPHLVHGTDLIEYLTTRKKNRSIKCKAREFYCCRCHHARQVTNNHVAIEIYNDRQLSISGHCQNCGNKVFRFGAVKKLADIRHNFCIQTIHDRRLMDSTPPIVNIDINKD